NGAAERLDRDHASGRFVHRAVHDRQRPLADRLLDAVAAETDVGHAGSRRLLPVITAGFSRPSIWSIVGATSEMRPCGTSFAPLRVGSTRTNGTGLVVCAVCGAPVTGSRISSQLP